MPAVPVIDLAALDPANVPAHLDAQLDAACRHWGLFQVTNHGIEASVIATAATEARRFFAEPATRKHEVVRSADNMWGWYDRELTQNARDLKEILDVGPAEGGHVPRWPGFQPQLRPALEAWMDACEALSRRLLAALASAMGVPRAELLQAFEPCHTSFARVNFYPTPEMRDAATHTGLPPDAGLGISQHTDAGALTVLWQDAIAGLQVWHAGAWVTVPPRPDALVINIGDVVQVWSNDRYRAPPHRVLATAGKVPRLSMPYFYNPAYATDYAPLAGVLRGAAPHYRPINWGEFRRLRAAGDYADLGEEVQIGHWRTD